MAAEPAGQPLADHDPPEESPGSPGQGRRV